MAKQKSPTANFFSSGEASLITVGMMRRSGAGSRGDYARRSPLEFFGPDKPPDVGHPPRTPLPLPAPRTHPDTHIQDKPGVLLSKETKKWEGGDQRGRLPTYATPQKGAAIAEAVPKHNSQTRSGPGGLGGCLPDRRCTGLSARRWISPDTTDHKP